jgi:hypothetical protein
MVIAKFSAVPGLRKPVQVPFQLAAGPGPARRLDAAIRRGFGMEGILRDAAKVMERHGRLEGHFWGRFEIDVKDEKGRIIDHREGPSRSFLRNFGVMFLQMIYLPNDNNATYTDDAGVARKFSVIDTGVDGATDTGGPVAAVADIACADNNGAVLSNQFNLLGTVMNAPFVVATTLNAENASHRNWQHQATILNTGVGTVNVVEAALFAHLKQGDLNGQNRRCMMMRDVFVAVPINPGSSAVITYIFDVAV